uniref:Uncharacterized protein n=1 Tax=viral metagenome TaxID=1070528 RepID=A0A6C0CZR3_9ZZZZ
MSQININNLYNNINKKKYEKYVVYDKILKRCHNKINIYAENLKLECIYEIPEYIFGLPIYNTTFAKNYIINRLEENGFIVHDVSNMIKNGIYISWDLSKSKNKSFKQKKVIKDEYKSIDDYKPNGLFIHNESGLNSINKKTNLLSLHL